ncbi:MAG: lytic transglycosylase domain-containing protein [Acidobacteria bacterium]|nr:lytic transglycosylase domain-containing protein [Acidobacteriota bacterium]
MTRLGSLGVAIVMLSALNASAPAQQGLTSPGDYPPRLFERADAKHLRSRRNLEGILREQPHFWRELYAVAARLETDPAWLLNVMACESLFDPDARNPLPGQTASGLLQIIERTAKRLGTTTEAIRRMSPVEQLRLVEKYLEPFRGRLKALADVYMAVFRGSIVEGGDAVVVVDSGKEPRVYALNRSLDINSDKRITKGELGLAALSVGRFLPAQAARGKKARNNPSVRSAFAQGKGETPRHPVESLDSAASTSGDSTPRTTQQTRSIYVRRGENR